MRETSLSIRNVLMLTIGALSMLVALFSRCSRFSSNGSGSKRIQSLQEAMVLGYEAFDATESLSVERDVSFFALDKTDASIAADLKDDVDESRKTAGDRLAGALPALQKYDFQELAPALKKIGEDSKELQKLRGEVDKNLALPYAQRDAALPDRWFKETTGLLAETRVLWINFMGHFNDIDPYVALQIRLKYFLVAITEYAGQERALIGRLLVRNRQATPAEQADLLLWQGKVDFSWEVSDLLAAQSNLYPAIDPPFRDARSHYANIYDMMHGMFYMPGVQQKTPYPISVGLWLELATEATDSLDTLKKAALKAAQVYVDRLQDRATHGIEIRLSVLLLSLALCFYSFRVVTSRVLRPIQELVDALLVTSEGKNVVPLPLPYDRQDEIGKLARVLRSFQKTMVESSATTGISSAPTRNSTTRLYRFP